MRVETTDIVLAGALKTLGYKMEHLEKVGSKGVFHFADVAEADIAKYDTGNMLVEPVAFSAAVRALTTASKRA